MADFSLPILRATIGVTLLLAGAACVRPTGDFGRPRPGVLHDQIMPSLGELRARAAGEPVSDFNLTDEEEEMHNRVWRFLVAPHSKDWFYDTAVELQRTRILPAQDTRFASDRYYQWLHETEFRSSRTRYQAIASHAKADLDTVPETFLSICAVIEIDRQRAVAARELVGPESEVLDEVGARRAENELHIAWFVRALGYRYDSYRYALEHLLVETPHEEAQNVDVRLGALADYVDAAERGDFCNGSLAGNDREHGGALPSRYSRTLDYDPEAVK